MGRLGWALAGVAAAVGAGIAIAVSSSAKAAAAKVTPASRLTPGHRYEFVALNAARTPKATLTTQLEALGWQYPVVYLYGDPYTPSDITWPPLADPSLAYAVRATWNGVDQAVPASWVGSFFDLIDKGVTA